MLSHIICQAIEFRQIIQKFELEESMQKRDQLIQDLKESGIVDPRVLKAIEEIPRECFLSSEQQDQAYDNIPLSIECQQTISQPYIIGLMTQSLMSGPEIHKVLEIGTGSGYQTAILARLIKRVYSLERHRYLLEQAQKRLKRLNITNVECYHRDGFEGLIQEGPFDGILVTAAPKEVPQSLLMQLSNKGRMIIPVGGQSSQTLQQINRDGESFHTQIIESVRFVPMLSGKQ